LPGSSQRKAGLLYCAGHFRPHLRRALIDADSTGRRDLQPLLPGTESVPFVNLAELETKLATRKFAAFVIEPIQSEAGIRVPPADYLRAAQALCKKYGTLFVLRRSPDRLHRTGPFLQRIIGAQSDMVCWQKR